MIDFVGTSLFLIIALQVAMTTMHFQIAQTDLFLRNIISWHLGGPREQFGIHEKLYWVCKVGQIRCRGYMIRHAAMGVVFGPQLYHRTSYKLKF